MIIGILAIVGISKSGSETSAVVNPILEANAKVSVCDGVSNAWQGLFIGILVFIILSFFVMIFINCVKSKEDSSYQVRNYGQS